MDWDAVDNQIPFLNYEFERGEAYDVAEVRVAGEFARLDGIGRV